MAGAIHMRHCPTEAAEEPAPPAAWGGCVMTTCIHTELARTVPFPESGLSAHTTADGRYVRISDRHGSWWQPTEPLLAILKTLPDWQDAGNDDDNAHQYGDWCRETAKAGYFHHTAAADTMPVPADFLHTDAED